MPPGGRSDSSSSAAGSAGFAARLPFDHAVEIDGWVFITGQMPTDPAALKVELARRSLSMIASWVTAVLIEPEGHAESLLAFCLLHAPSLLRVRLTARRWGSCEQSVVDAAPKLLRALALAEALHA